MVGKFEAGNVADEPWTNKAKQKHEGASHFSQQDNNENKIIIE